jgi:hypothetical protein
MSIFDIFKTKKQKNPSEELVKRVMAELDPKRGLFSATELLLLATVRQTALTNGIPPRWETTNSEIIEICKLVYRAFSIAEVQRGERLDDRTFGAFAIYCLAAREAFPKDFVDEHVKYEAEKYARTGLRDTYDEFRKRNLGAAWDAFPFRMVLSAIEQGQ